MDYLSGLFTSHGSEKSVRWGTVTMRFLAHVCASTTISREPRWPNSNSSGVALVMIVTSSIVSRWMIVDDSIPVVVACSG